MAPTECNLVFGRTGCGKTSLKNMLCGGEPEEDSLTSGTSEAEILHIEIQEKQYMYVDTAGILDNRGDGQELMQSRAGKVNSIGAMLMKKKLNVARVFYCVTSSERLLKEEIDWLSDIIQMLGGEKVMKCFIVVLTKVDAGFGLKKFQKDMDNMKTVKLLRVAFKNCPIVTSGYDNVDDVVKWLVPLGGSQAFTVGPEDFKTITPKADLETQVMNMHTNLKATVKALEDGNMSEEQCQRQISELECEIDKLAEGISNASWWCTAGQIADAKNKMKTCRGLIWDLRTNKDQSIKGKAAAAKKKKELTDMLALAEKELAEKKTIGGMFRMLVEAATGPKA